MTASTFSRILFWAWVVLNALSAGLLLVGLVAGVTGDSFIAQFAAGFGILGLLLVNVIAAVVAVMSAIATRERFCGNLRFRKSYVKDKNRELDRPE